MGVLKLYPLLIIISPDSTIYRTSSIWGRFLSAVLCLVAQSCPTLCDAMDSSLPGSSVKRILQPRVLEWVAMPSSRDLSDPGMEPGSPSLQVDSFPTELPGQTFSFLLVFYQIWKSFTIIFFSRHILLLLLLFPCSKMVTSLLQE